MNSRIQLLAEQAEQYANEQNDKHGRRFKPEYDRKFAQLIAEELAGTLSRLPTGGTDSQLWYKHQSAFNQHLGI